MKLRFQRQGQSPQGLGHLSMNMQRKQTSNRLFKTNTQARQQWSNIFFFNSKYEPRILNPILNYQDYRKALLTSMNLENTTPSQPFLRILCEVKLYLPSHDRENSSKRIYETHLKIFRCTSWTKIKVQLSWRLMCKYYYSDKTEIIQLKNVRWRKKSKNSD